MTAPPPRCPGCSGPMGDGDRVLYGRCGRCAGCYPDLPPVARSARRCWCGRRVSTLPDGNGFECSEHDDPIPGSATGPSTPLTPGGVFAATQECPRCHQPMVDHDQAPGLFGLVCPVPYFP